MSDALLDIAMNSFLLLLAAGHAGEPAQWGAIIDSLLLVLLLTWIGCGWPARCWA